MGRLARTVLLLGNYRPSLPVARSLRALGCRLVVGRGGAGDYTSFVERSRSVSEVWDHAPWTAGEDAVGADLEGLLERRPDIGAVFPISEEAVLLVSRRRHRLPQQVVPVVPGPGVAEACVDKPGMLERCRRVGVSQAPHAVVRDRDALFRVVAELGLPCVLRPGAAARELQGQRALTVRSGEELERWFPAWPADQDAVIVQRRVEGHRENVYFAALEGEVLDAVGVRITSTDRPDGTGFAIEGISVASEVRLRAESEALVADLRYTGIGCLQFMVDERSGAPSFLELNPRAGGNLTIAERCGLPLSRMALELAEGRRPAIGRPPWSHAGGVRFAWTKCALSGLVWTWRRGELTPGGAALWLGRTAWAGLRADCHITWSWRDPIPTLSDYAASFRRLGRQEPEPAISSAPVP